MEKEKSGQTPKEGKWFEVNPLEIEQKLFQKKRPDLIQEKTRRLILDALNEFENNPQKYGEHFKTMVPKKGVGSKTVQQLFGMARKLGDHNADWVEQALVWAQRIANGESWESICNIKDTANCYRLVIWKDGYAHRVGSSRYANDDNTATYVSRSAYYFNHSVYHTVPLIVGYDK